MPFLPMTASTGFLLMLDAIAPTISNAQRPGLVKMESASLLAAAVVFLPKSVSMSNASFLSTAGGAIGARVRPLHRRAHARIRRLPMAGRIAAAPALRIAVFVRLLFVIIATAIRAMAVPAILV